MEAKASSYPNGEYPVQTSVHVDVKFCGYCKNDLSHLSDWGFLNHVEFCRIVEGVPNVKVGLRRVAA